MAKKELPFEEGLKRLEELVCSLEDRDLGLDKALAAFEEGLTLSGNLRKKLDEAAGKVEILTRDLAGRSQARPWDLRDDSGVDIVDEEEDNED